VRRGVTVGAGGFAAAASQCAGAAPQITAELVQQTLRHADLFLLTGAKVGDTAATAKSTSLAQGELRNMFLTNLSTSVGIAVLAVVLVVGGPLAANIIGFRTGAWASTVFFDDFEDGNEKDGNPVTWLPGSETSGTGQVVAGDYVLSGTRLSSFAAGSNPFRDGSIRTQLRFLQPNNSTFAYLYSRSPTEVDAAYVGGIRQDGLLAIVETSAGVPDQIHATAATSLSPLTRDVILQLDTFGSRISLSAWHVGDPQPAQPQLVVFDNTLTSGEFGVGITSTGGGPPSQVAFRQFSAVPEPTTVVLGSMSGLVLASFAFRIRMCRTRGAR
jgi:hypothetical protein